MSEPRIQRRLSAILAADVVGYSRLMGVDETGTRTRFRAHLGEVIESVVQERESDLRSAGGHVRVGPMPTVFGVPGALDSVFANLIDNAIKYRAPDRAPEVRVHAIEDGAYVQIDVADNGQSFDPRHAEKVFGLFQQLDPAPGRSGMGVGLALCKKIVERHGGTIHATARPGVGTTFHVRLPRSTGRSTAPVNTR